MFFICCSAVSSGYVQAEECLTFVFCVACHCFEGQREQEKTKVFVATLEPEP